MSSDYDIEMFLDDTLELDTIIQEWTPSSDLVNVNPEDTNNSFNIGGFQTNTTVFDPDDPGVYNIDINGQTLKVNVRGSGTEVIIDDFEDNDISDWDVYNGNGSTSTQTQKSVVSKGQYAMEISTNNAGGSDAGTYLDTNSLSPTKLGHSIRWENASKYPDLRYRYQKNGTDIIQFHLQPDKDLIEVQETLGSDYSASTSTVSAEFGRWYRSEYRNIDWDNEVFDWYVDDTEILKDVPFVNSSSNVDRINIWHRTFSDGLSYHDNINMIT